MAVTYPGAEFRPLGPQTQDRMSAHDIVCLHTMAGSLAGTAATFEVSGLSGSESHFGVGARGEVVQWQDLEFRADANLEGNHGLISIETADKGAPFPDWEGADIHLDVGPGQLHGRWSRGCASASISRRASYRTASRTAAASAITGRGSRARSTTG